MRSVAFLLFVVGVLLLTGCGTIQANPQSENRMYQYFDGTAWHSVQVQLNQLQVERLIHQKASTEVIMLRQGVGSVAELNDVAQQMRSAQSDIVMTSAFVRETHIPQAPPQRLTNKIVVRTEPHVSMASISDKYQLRVIEAVTYSANTYICEVMGMSLIVGLQAAEKIQREPGVIFSMPLFERSRVRK